MSGLYAPGHRILLICTSSLSLLSRDLLEIGNQSRPKIFDLNIRKPEVLYSAVLEVDERVTLVGYDYDPKGSDNAPRFDAQGKLEKPYSGQDGPPAAHGGGEAEVVKGVSGEAVAILKKPEREVVKKDLQKLFDDGFRALAVVLM